jgi:hypothetical protein
MPSSPKVTTCFIINGQRFCVEKILERDPINHPDPRWWQLEVEGINNEVIQDLGRLASIRGIAEGLSLDQARPVFAVLDAGLAKINKALPQGYEVSVGH